jgi:hypothetical protein
MDLNPYERFDSHVDRTAFSVFKIFGRLALLYALLRILLGF